jgi:hypothetical protein
MRKAFTYAVLPLLLAAAPAFAQSQNQTQDQEEDLSDIIVTGVTVTGLRWGLR